MLDVVGFDPATPPVMADFARAWIFYVACSEGAAHCDRCRCGDTPVFGTEAQLVERPFVKRLGAGSNPAGPARSFDLLVNSFVSTRCSSVGEHLPRAQGD